MARGRGPGQAVRPHARGAEVNRRGRRGGVGGAPPPTPALHQDAHCLHGANATANPSDRLEPGRGCRQGPSGVGGGVGTRTSPTPPRGASRRGPRPIGVGGVGRERSLVHGDVGETPDGIGRGVPGEDGPGWPPRLHRLHRALRGPRRDMDILRRRAAMPMEDRGRSEHGEVTEDPVSSPYGVRGAGAHARCAAAKRDGCPCGCPAQPGRRYCFNHDPARVQERRENARLGARLKGSKRELGAAAGARRRGGAGSDLSGVRGGLA